MSLLNFLKPKRDVSIVFNLDGTEKIRYGEIDEVFDRLKDVGAALALFPIKNISPRDPSAQWMYALTDGMTDAQVQEASDSIVGLMETLKCGSEEPYHADVKVAISKDGAMLTLNGTEIGFPFQGVTQEPPGGHKQQRIAERRGENLYLRLVVNDGDEVYSDCTWIIDRANQKISFSLKEARYWQVKDYGRVLLNQEIEASGAARG
ncbi:MULTISPECIES: hypothetical protein [Burkholderia]|uniref:hypothetical protein n=1 Tax=Burkholderia TaxID=32008 RepID=UPI00055798FE|nr:MULTISPECIES: hypothetical protein [Burkholderia]KVR74012.1 hypothetical protein WK24_00460 [Burkholderia vietnamiensis]MBR8087478.1 hypothetical protein [Burkholderia vietnamiensis]MBU9317047.1 hypothetical protein [Burkholderia multivorans]MDN7820962.1 hypothetical protein [Burkholderia vietnamiensis]MDN7942006.1 hypothetical protein [Burkholderia multivorans]